MNLTFDQAMEFTRTVSTHTAFEDEECEAYFDVLMSLEWPATILEIGLEYGRSSSIALQVAKERELLYIGIDPFTEHAECDVQGAWRKMAAQIGPSHCFLNVAPSDDVKLEGRINAILIDGNHTYEQVKRDCEHFLPSVVQGGYAFFHDCNREFGVDAALDEYFKNNVQWEPRGIIGSLGIMRRL